MPVTPDDVAEEWLDVAQRDLDAAILCATMPDIAAFHLQQAIEKALSRN